jgi:hypothetical protein
MEKEKLVIITKELKKLRKKNYLNFLKEYSKLLKEQKNAKENRKN